MALFLGIDTSNYTTSAALYDDQTGEAVSERKLLPVKPGAIGQRQSDAVFGHVKQLGDILETVLASKGDKPAAVGVSASPRDEVGSYMPCFLAGDMAAKSVAAALGIPRYTFSHQAGHVMAALYSAGKLELRQRPFLAFHVSGGTTECLLCRPHSGTILQIATIAGTLDLNAGQAVDRVGAMLHLPFPAGPHLEQLAEQSGESYRPRPTLKDGDCCLSGLENQCQKQLEEGSLPEDVAKYCLCYLEQTLLEMTRRALEKHPGLPLVFAGGVMSNRYLQRSLNERFGGFFAEPRYSADNAVGTAVLCALRHREETGL